MPIKEELHVVVAGKEDLGGLGKFLKVELFREIKSFPGPVAFCIPDPLRVIFGRLPGG